MIEHRTLLAETIKLQDMARELLAEQHGGKAGTAEHDDKMASWVLYRRRVAGLKVDSAHDALALVHTMSQAAVTLASPSGADDPECSRVFGREVLLACCGLIAFLEREVGATRADLGLHDDFVGPVLN